MKLFFVLITISSLGFGISQEKANEVVEQYDTMSKRILGFINCVSRVMTGSEAITEIEGKTLVKTPAPSGLDGCFVIAGFKSGPGFSKLAKLFSKEKAEPSLGSETGTAVLDSPPDLDKLAEEVRKDLVKEAEKNRQPTAH